MSKFAIHATWDDCGHLSTEVKAELWASIPPYQRDARSKGIPQLGSGAIYQVPESDITIPDFEIPRHFPRAYALDSGWNCTAALWGALDRESQVAYVYSVYKRNQAEPSVHAGAIQSRGRWIPGVGDVAAINNQDGQQYIDMYKRLGLDIQLANKAVEAGIQETWELLSAGRIKVFASCKAFFEEYRLYRRDDKGRIVKENDHLMDCLRMWVKSGRERASVPPAEVAVAPQAPYELGVGRSNAWMR